MATRNEVYFCQCDKYRRGKLQDETWTDIQVRFIYKRDGESLTSQLNQIVLPM